MTTARIPAAYAAPIDFASIYKRCSFFAAFADLYKGIARGAAAARALADCRRHLQWSREALAAGDLAEARRQLHFWQNARQRWAHLANQTH